jgi:hypothetical protein
VTLRAACLLVALAASSSVYAQTPPQPLPPQPARPAPAQPRFGVRGYLLFGSVTLAAKDTLEAVANTHRRTILGGGGQVTNIWKGVFADVAGSQLSVDGERVFIDNRRVFKLGVPLEITMLPVDVAGGWRFSFWRGRLFPYAAAGVSYLRYEETSEFAQSGEDVRESKAGPLVLAGADVRVWRWISAGGEVRWRRVRGILGEQGASAEFSEDDAGGVHAALRISIGR